MTQLSHNLIGQSPAWLATLDTISGLAAINRPILVVGERGTGKTVVAGRLHFLSKRWEQTWQAVNCSTFDEATLETEIFGGGGFDSESLIARAQGGTLFIDTIETLPLRLQAKLLHLIETGEYTPTNAQIAETADVRIIAASAEDLPSRVATGLFRADLLDVLAYDVITLPPLRARKSDAHLLAENFAASMVSDLGEDSFPGFNAEVLEFLHTYAWPGNIRELKTLVERAVGRAWNDETGLSVPIGQINIDPFISTWRLSSSTLGPNQPADQNAAKSIITAPASNISASHISATSTPPTQVNPQTPAAPKTTDLQKRVNIFELSILAEALAHTDNHQGKAAKYLGLTYHQFRGLLRKHGLKK